MRYSHRNTNIDTFKFGHPINYQIISLVPKTKHISFQQINNQSIIKSICHSNNNANENIPSIEDTFTPPSTEFMDGEEDMLSDQLWEDIEDSQPPIGAVMKQVN